MQQVMNMKDSHFQIGASKQSNMSPAPYKVSNPEGVSPPQPIDKNKLGRESWTLGTYPDIYKTINQVQYNSPTREQTGNAGSKDAIKALKARVGGTSIKNEVGKIPDPQALYKTSSKSTHKTFDEISIVSKEL